MVVFIYKGLDLDLVDLGWGCLGDGNKGILCGERRVLFGK